MAILELCPQNGRSELASPKMTSLCVAQGQISNPSVQRGVLQIFPATTYEANQLHELAQQKDT